MKGDVALRNESVKPFGACGAWVISSSERPQNEKESLHKGAWNVQTLYMTSRICT
jgi:hypothetical protein